MGMVPRRKVVVGLLQNGHCLAGLKGVAEKEREKREGNTRPWGGSTKTDVAFLLHMVMMSMKTALNIRITSYFGYSRYEKYDV